MKSGIPIVILVFLIESISCSTGDQLPYYLECLQYCFYFNCSSQMTLQEFDFKQSSLLKLIGWNCEEECNYDCQWSTINYLIDEKNVSQLPQFYGKWTFKRYFGLQEPASAIFSLMNLITYLISWNHYISNTIKLTFHDRPLSPYKLKEFYQLCYDKEFVLNTFNAIAALNAWFWSTIFHCKDFLFTERMDYFSAFLFVISGFAVSLIKLMDELPRFRRAYIQSSILVVILSFGIFHESHLLSDKIDYQYNMRVNLTLGISSTLFWLIWCAVRYGKYRSRSEYLFKCIYGLLMMNLFLTFEIFDFPPLLFIFDAHSIFHFSTIFLPFIWYSFLLDEFKFRTNSKSYLNLTNNRNT